MGWVQGGVRDGAPLQGPAVAGNPSALAAAALGAAAAAPAVANRDAVRPCSEGGCCCSGCLLPAARCWWPGLPLLSPIGALHGLVPNLWWHRPCALPQQSTARPSAESVVASSLRVAPTEHRTA